MLYILILFLFCVSFGLTLWRRRVGLTVFALSLALAVLFGSRAGTNLVLDGLQADFTPPQPVHWGDNNAIIVLGVGTQRPSVGEVEPTVWAYSRIVKGAELYWRCASQVARRCRVILSGGDALKTGESEAEVYARTLTGLGVPAAWIIREGDSLNTFQNARNTGAIIADMEPDKTVLVTSGFHMLRAQLYFRHFGMKPQPVRSDYLQAPPSGFMPTAYNQALLDRGLHEYHGILQYHVYNLRGLNPPKRDKPGDP